MPRLTGELQRLSQCMRQYKNRLLAPYGIGTRSALILNFVDLIPECSQEMLAERLMLDKSTIARRLAVLEERGFLNRMPNPADRRGQLLRLTEKGQELLPVIREVNKKWFDFLTEGEDPEELEQMEATLTKLLRKAQEHLKGDEKP